MCKVYAVSNQKGGTGKSTLSVNIAIGLARMGKKVLLIDADSQGSASVSLGFQEPDRMEVTLATIFERVINDEQIHVDDGILIHEEGVFLLPGNIELAGVEVSMVNIMSRELILRQYIQMIKEHYDAIIIDCAPALGMITINALAAADAIIIPVSCQFLPVKGLEQLIRTIGKVKRQINPKLQIAGIAITMQDNRTNYARDIIQLIDDTYGKQVPIFKNFIPMSVRVSECSVAGCSIYKHDPKGKATKAFEGLTKEVLAFGIHE